MASKTNRRSRRSSRGRRAARITVSRRGISAGSRRSPSRRRSTSALSRMLELPREMGVEALRVARRSLPI